MSTDWSIERRDGAASGIDGFDDGEAISVVRTADLDLLLRVRSLAVCTYARLARAIAAAPTGKLGSITTADGIREFVEAYAPAEESDR